MTACCLSTLRDFRKKRKKDSHRNIHLLPWTPAHTHWFTCHICSMMISDMWGIFLRHLALKANFSTDLENSFFLMYQWQRILNVISASVCGFVSRCSSSEKPFIAVTTMSQLISQKFQEEATRDSWISWVNPPLQVDTSTQEAAAPQVPAVVDRNKDPLQLL